MSTNELRQDPNGQPCDSVYHRWTYDTDEPVTVDVTRQSDIPCIPDGLRCQCGKFTFGEAFDDYRNGELDDIDVSVTYPKRSAQARATAPKRRSR